MFIMTCYGDVNLDVSTIYYITLRPVTLIMIDNEVWHSI